jgi:hypothetical protein
MSARIIHAVASLGLAALMTMPLAAGQRSGRGAGPGPAPAAPQPPKPPKAAARIDLTGTWVTYVTEDWRFRMVTPPKGDYTSMPLNAEGKRVADLWDWRKDQKSGAACKAYGAAGVMRMPTRLRISWQDDYTLKIETDAGTQTRTLMFSRPAAASAVKPAAAPAKAGHTLQGTSLAEWEKTDLPASGLGILAIPAAPASYALKAVTASLSAGYLRTNGVPYGDNAVLTEYFDTLTHTNGQEWLILTSVVDDPQYLLQPFVTTTHFKREPDNSRWRPTPCEIVPPVIESKPAFPS